MRLLSSPRIVPHVPSPAAGAQQAGEVPAVATHPVASGVDHELADPEEPQVPDRQRPPQDGPHAGDELGALERLRDVVVGPDLERPHEVPGGRPGRDDDEGDLRALSQPPAHLEAVEAGEPQVEHHQVERIGQRPLEAGGAVGLGVATRIPVAPSTRAITSRSEGSSSTTSTRSSTGRASVDAAACDGQPGDGGHAGCVRSRLSQLCHRRSLVTLGG